MKTTKLFAKLIEKEIGITFDFTRERYLQQAIKKRMSLLGIKREEDYYQLLLNPLSKKEELKELSKLITIPETHFFRHSEQFEALATYIIPALMEKKRQAGDMKIKIWSAGCSSGEEAYSIAITLAMTREKLKDFAIKIFATDINEDMLNRAKRGIYRTKDVAKLPKEYQRYFLFKGEECEVKPEIKKMVTFFPLNLVKEPFPIYLLNNLDIIFCRNVFIYFREKTVKRILRNFYLCLKPHGYLIVAPTESLVIDKSLFASERLGQAFVYRKKPILSKPIQPKEVRQRLSFLDIDTQEVKPEPPSQKEGPEDLLKSVKMLADIGAYKKALEICQKISSQYPSFPENYLLLGIIHYEMGHTPEAIADFKKAIYLEPNFAMAHFYLGNVFWHLGKIPEAVKSYKNTVKSLEAGPYYGILPQIMDVISPDELRTVCEEYIKS